MLHKPRLRGKGVIYQKSDSCNKAVDDRSGVLYQEYHLSDGENVLMALRFLFNAMSAKSQKHLQFQGIPLMIYLDNGPVAKSLIFQRVCKHTWY